MHEINETIIVPRTTKAANSRETFLHSELAARARPAVVLTCGCETLCPLIWQSEYQSGKKQKLLIRRDGSRKMRRDAR
jgi:hypothetical protein